jgi:hypothetical protein
LRQEDVKNINSSLNKCLEEGHHVLTLDDFAALSQSNTIIEKIKKLETEINAYCNQTQLIDSVPFHISNQKLFEMINTSGTIEAPREFLFSTILYQHLFFFIATPSFVQQKCKASYTYLDIEWESTKYNPPITAYILELKQSNNDFSEVCFLVLVEKIIRSIKLVLLFKTTNSLQI